MVIGGEAPPTTNQNSLVSENQESNSDGVVFSTNRCIFLSQYNNKVKEAAKMNYPRMNHCCESHEQKSYVIGGVTGTIGQLVENIEIYDQISKTWTVGPKMITPRSHACSVNMNGIIYIIGGMDKNGKLLQSVEYFDVKKNEFSQVFTKLKKPNPEEGAPEIDISSKKILARGLINSTAAKIGWNKFLITGGSYKSDLTDTQTGQDKFELNSSVLDFVVQESWNFVKIESSSKHNTLYSHQSTSAIRYDGKLLLIGGNNLNSSCEYLNIETLASYQSNINLSGLDSSEVIATIVETDLSQSVSEVYTNAKNHYLYIFGIDGKKEIWRLDMRDMSW
jgi:hypothetical protein